MIYGINKIPTQERNCSFGYYCT